MTEKTLNYHFVDGTHIIFDKYIIDISGNVINKKSGRKVKFRKKGDYNACSVIDDDGKTRDIQIGRALASTFIGPPITLKHTADHIDRDPDNDTLGNIRWNCKSGQRENQVRPDTMKTAFVVVKDGVEKTANEWVAHLKGNDNHNGRGYTQKKIREYARRKQYGYSYKEYRDIPGEIWKKVINSETSQGRWEISNMNRVKYATKYAENVIEGVLLCLDGKGYPIISINGKKWPCHILSFMTFFPKEYAVKKQNEMVLHEYDDKLDFRPHRLRLGTQSENTTDAYNNGKYIGTKSARVICFSYINSVLEKEHESLTDAVNYLKAKGFEKASKIGISKSLEAFKEGKVSTRYGRTWKT